MPVDSLGAVVAVEATPEVSRSPVVAVGAAVVVAPAVGTQAAEAAGVPEVSVVAVVEVEDSAAADLAAETAVAGAAENITDCFVVGPSRQHPTASASTAHQRNLRLAHYARSSMRSTQNRGQIASAADRAVVVVVAEMEVSAVVVASGDSEEAVGLASETGTEAENN